MTRSCRSNQKGIALVTALIVTLGVMVMATGVLVFVNVSSDMSGSGKRYATAAEAADSGIGWGKDRINRILRGDSLGGCLDETVIAGGAACQTVLNLPASINGAYRATVTIEKLFISELAGGRLEFPPAGGGAPKTGVFFKITTVVVGPDNTTAENSILYRFAG